MQKARLNQLKTKLAQLKAIKDHMIDHREANISRSEKTLDLVNVKLEENTEVCDILLEVKAAKNAEIKMLEGIVNEGLQYAYPDRAIKFEIKFVPRRNKIEMDFTLNDKIIKSPFKGEGGGIFTTISLLLYLSKCFIEKKKIIMLDESMKMVDLEASTRLLYFLKSFAIKYDCKILVISHKNFDITNTAITDKISIGGLIE